MILTQAKKAKEASIKLIGLSTQIKNKALLKIADKIKENLNQILDANKKDTDTAIKFKLKNELLKRLILDEHKINEMVLGLKSVANLKDPVGRTLSKLKLDDGLTLFQVSCPIGVIGVIFESRPDAVIQISALCLKSGNSVILKGGSESKHSNRILAKLISDALKECQIPQESVQLIESRDEVSKLLKLKDYIDLVIPRGGNSFVKYVQEHTKIPVLGHSEGVCHIFVDESADLKKAIDVCLDAKCQYPAACNSMETLLVHKGIAKIFLSLMSKRFSDANVKIVGDDDSSKILKEISKASEKDWSTEYSGLKLSVKVVNSLREAINHINKYGSRHTDSIITRNKKNAKEFMDLVDSASVMWNTSTRFADGFRYGKGAEIGISTSKIHSRGPVGLEGLVIYKYKLIGKGHLVKDYIGKNARKFKHQKLKTN